VLCRRVVCHGCVGFERVNVNWCGVVFLLCLYSDAGRLTVLVTACELCYGL